MLQGKAHDDRRITNHDTVVVTRAPGWLISKCYTVWDVCVCIYGQVSLHVCVNLWTGELACVCVCVEICGQVSLHVCVNLWTGELGCVCVNLWTGEFAYVCVFV